jgi:hypothetical protein
VQSLTSIPFGWQIKRSRDESHVCLALLLVNDSSDCTAPLAASNAALRRRAIAMHEIGLRPLVSASDFKLTPAAQGSVDVVGRFPTVHVRGRVELPSNHLYVVAVTASDERRIIAADLVRGPGSAEFLLSLPPHVTRRRVRCVALRSGLRNSLSDLTHLQRALVDCKDRNGTAGARHPERSEGSQNRWTSQRDPSSFRDSG